MKTKETKWMENGVWKYKDHVVGSQLWNTRPDGSLDIGHIMPDIEDVRTHRADQQYKQECDINNIMKRFGATGQISHLAKNPGFYGEFSQMIDFREATEMVARARDMFMDLPAELRSKFDNDPGKLVEFANDPSNLEQAIELGLVEGKVSKKNDDSNNDIKKQQPKQKTTTNSGTVPKKDSSSTDEE